MEQTPPSIRREIALSVESQVIMYLSANIRQKMTISQGKYSRSGRYHCCGRFTSESCDQFK